MSNARTNNQNLIDGEVKWSVKRGMATIELVHIGDRSTEWRLLGELKRCPL